MPICDDCGGFFKELNEIKEDEACGKYYVCDLCKEEIENV